VKCAVRRHGKSIMERVGMADQNTDKEPQSKSQNPTAEEAKAAKSPTEEAKGVKVKPEDAIALLKNDHRKVEQLFETYEKAGRRSEKQKLARQICLELIVHTTLEEEIFYPACRDHVDDGPLDEAQVEHDGAKVLINELLAGSPDQPYYDAKVKVLSEMIKHHVNEEEQRNEGLFAKAKAGGVDTDEIAQRLTARKAELLAEAEKNGPERPRPRSFTAPSETIMRQNQYRDRDDRARAGRDEDYDERRSASNRSRGAGGRYDEDADLRSSRGRMPERDEDGRFMSDNEDRSGSSRSRRSSERYDDDQGYSSRSRGGMVEDEGERGYANRARGGRYGGDQDDRNGDRDRGVSSRSRDNDDDDRSGRSRSSEARGRDERGRFVSDEDDDDRRVSSSRGRSMRSRDDDDDDGDGRGWYGDSEGHSEAARRGWEQRGNGGRSSSRGQGARSSRSSDDDEDRRSSNSPNSTNSSRGRSRDQGGWFGDSRGHAEAARRGWDNRQ